MNPFVRSWEEDPAFRAFVESERAAGRLSQREVDAMASLPGRLESAHAEDPAVVTALQRAHELVDGAEGAVDPYHAWKDWVIPGQ